MSTDLHPVRALVATVVGGAAGGLLPYVLVMTVLAPSALGVRAPSGVWSLLVWVCAGATLGAAAALALALRDDDRSQTRVTVLTVLAAGVLWTLVSVLVTAAVLGGLLVLPLAALLGRHLATR